MFENPEMANRSFYVLFFQRRRQSLRQNVSFTGVSNKPRFLEISVVSQKQIKTFLVERVRMVFPEVVPVKRRS